MDTNRPYSRSHAKLNTRGSLHEQKQVASAATELIAVGTDGRSSTSKTEELPASLLLHQCGQLWTLQHPNQEQY